MHNPLHKLPLDPLRGFVAAARELSFTRAAQSLHLTQSAISRQVQALEEALGVLLFVRGVRRLELTDAGVRLARAAEAWLQDYAALADSLRSPAPRPVTITASIGMSSLWLVPRLAHFQSLHPDIEVRIAANNRLVDLAREDVDLAIRYCANRDAPPGARHLFGEAVMPVASPAYAVRNIDRASLPEITLLEFDDAGFTWLSWRDWLVSMSLDDVRPRAVLRFSHYDQLIQAAVAGQGIAIGREQLLRGLLQSGQLRVVGDARRNMHDRGYWLATASPHPREAVTRVADWLLQQAASHL